MLFHGIRWPHTPKNPLPRHICWTKAPFDIISLTFTYAHCGVLLLWWIKGFRCWYDSHCFHSSCISGTTLHRFSNSATTLLNRFTSAMRSLISSRVSLISFFTKGLTSFRMLSWIFCFVGPAFCSKISRSSWPWYSTFEFVPLTELIEKGACSVWSWCDPELMLWSSCPGNRVEFADVYWPGPLLFDDRADTPGEFNVPPLKKDGRKVVSQLELWGLWPDRWAIVFWEVWTPLLLVHQMEFYKKTQGKR